MRLASARTFVLAAAASLVVAACAPTPAAAPSSSSGGPVATPSETSTPGTAGPVEVPERLRFETTTLDGEPFSGESIFGTPTVLWFWAPWCPVCNADAPLVADALDEFPEGVQIIGVPGRSDEDSMRDFVATYGLEAMPQIVDADGSLWANFSISSQPAVVLIEADGTIRLHPGSVGKAGLLEYARSIS